MSVNGTNDVTNYGTTADDTTARVFIHGRITEACREGLGPCGNDRNGRTWRGKGRDCVC